MHINNSSWGGNPNMIEEAANTSRPPFHSAESISARLDRLPATKTIWKFVVLISFGVFFELYDLLYTAYIAPGLVAEGILTTTTSNLFGMTGIASFIAALFAGLFIGTIACGFLSDKFGRKAIFTYSLLWYVAANFIMAFQETAFGLNFWRFIVGLGIGVEMVTISAYLSEMVPKKIRGRAFACCHAIGFAAVPVVALLAYFLVPLKPLGLEGWRWVVIIGCHGAIFIWWIRRQLPESPRWLAMKGRLAEADQIMSDIEAKVQAESRQPLPPSAATFPISSKARLRDIFQPPYRQRAVMMSIFNFFQTIGYYGFANWVPTLLIQQGITVTSSLMYSILIAIAAPIGPIIGLYIGDKFERKQVIVLLSAGSIICGLLFSQQTHFAGLITMGIGLMLTGNIISYSYHAYQAELFPTSIRARAVGFVYSWSRFSAIFTGFMIAGILKWFGVVGVFIFISMATGVTMLVIGLLGPKTKDIALESISSK
jgi:MFS transporter, putative metabolite:H+ symporter